MTYGSVRGWVGCDSCEEILDNVYMVDMARGFEWPDEYDGWLLEYNKVTCPECQEKENEQDHLS